MVSPSRLTSVLKIRNTFTRSKKTPITNRQKTIIANTNNVLNNDSIYYACFNLKITYLHTLDQYTIY